MGNVILALALLVEAGFVAYRLVTKSNQSRVAAFVRLGAFAVFILLALVSVIRWDFRWYGLAALLFVWAALGGWALLRGREDSAYRPGRIVFNALAALLLIVVVLAPALILPQYRPPKVSGGHPVATASYTYTDTARLETFAGGGQKRRINVEFWYPKDGTGRYPLVVFSHGAFGMKTSNTSTFMELASNGYVVCSIDHPYHALFTAGSDGQRTLVDPAFFQEVLDTNNGKYDEATTFKLEKKWMQLRVDDINFALDTILAQAKQPGSGAVYQLIDPARIGLMGHSLGGESSAQVARQRSDVAAVVNLDADLGGEYLDYADGKYVMNQTPYPIPLLTILADDLVRLLDAIPNADAVVAVQRISASAPRAYEVHITGTDHQSLTDLPLASPFLVSLITTSVKKAGGGETADPYYVIETMNTLVLQFFNVYLKGQGSFTPKKTY